ncbi:hypothetical protein M885DRAFT_575144 [Pelagophyceae sp. CCMP2097]|nr:hypothetical protein M885DRAFT_575144 [Pelagophyceae sp. CCMP2097]
MAEEHRNKRPTTGFGSSAFSYKESCESGSDDEDSMDVDGYAERTVDVDEEPAVDVDAEPTIDDIEVLKHPGFIPAKKAGSRGRFDFWFLVKSSGRRFGSKSPCKDEDAYLAAKAEHWAYAVAHWRETTAAPTGTVRRQLFNFGANVPNTVRQLFEVRGLPMTYSPQHGSLPIPESVLNTRFGKDINLDSGSGWSKQFLKVVDALLYHEIGALHHGDDLLPKISEAYAPARGNGGEAISRVDLAAMPHIKKMVKDVTDLKLRRARKLDIGHAAASLAMEFTKVEARDLLALDFTDREWQAAKTVLLDVLKLLTDENALQQLAHGSKEVTLSCGKKVTVPAALRVRVPSALYDDYVAALPALAPRLSKTVFLGVAKDVSTGKLTARVALDPIVVKAGQTIRLLLSLVDELTEVAEEVRTRVKKAIADCEVHLKCLGAHLVAARQACRGTEGDCDGCADHCLCFSFGDASGKDQTLPEVCPHPHRCVACSSLAIVGLELEALVKEAQNVAGPQEPNEAVRAPAHGGAGASAGQATAGPAGPPEGSDTAAAAAASERPQARTPEEDASTGAAAARVAAGLLAGAPLPEDGGGAPPPPERPRAAALEETAELIRRAFVYLKHYNAHEFRAAHESANLARLLEL